MFHQPPRPVPRGTAAHETRTNLRSPCANGEKVQITAVKRRADDARVAEGRGGRAANELLVAVPRERRKVGEPHGGALHVDRWVCAAVPGPCQRACHGVPHRVLNPEPILTVVAEKGFGQKRRRPGHLGRGGTRKKKPRTVSAPEALREPWCPGTKFAGVVDVCVCARAAE